jgi:signal transduction histidine kinase
MELSAVELETAYTTLKQEAEGNRKLLQKLQQTLELMSDGQPETSLQPSATDTAKPTADLHSLADRLKHEVAARQVAEKEMRRQQANIQAILTASPNPIGAIDAQGVLLAANTAFQGFWQQVAGITVAEGENWLAQLPDYERQVWSNFIANARNHHRHDSLVSYGIEGELKHYDCILTAILTDNQYSGAVINLTDITERQKAATELKSSNSQLTQTLEELRATQENLVQHERTAALQQLVAGVAHEVNTPLGAMLALSGNLKDVISTLDDQMFLFWDGLDDATKSLFCQALVYLHARESASTLNTREERKLRRQVQKQLESVIPEDDLEVVARHIVNLQLHDDLERWQALWQKPDLLALLNRFHLLLQGVEELQLAGRQMSKIIFALRHYASVHSNAEQRTELNLRQTLTLALDTFRAKLVDIDLQLEVPDGFVVLANPDDLIQVWVNVIANALQAMEYSGSLYIETRHIPSFEQVEVQITDTGPGIPPEIAPRVFDAFFTTRSSGEGTGLGLYVCRQIVLGLGGRMDFETSSDGTTFRITLPLAYAPAY